MVMGRILHVSPPPSAHCSYQRRNQGLLDIRIHDTVLSDDAPGFYAAMDAYRYGRLEYLPDLVDFERWRGCDILDMGCGAGPDLVRFARAGARAVGVDEHRHAPETSPAGGQR
jgi:SAM-dependent methyltransferase